MAKLAARPDNDKPIVSHQKQHQQQPQQQKLIEQQPKKQVKVDLVVPSCVERISNTDTTAFFSRSSSSSGFHTDKERQLIICDDDYNNNTSTVLTNNDNSSDTTDTDRDGDFEHDGGSCHRHRLDSASPKPPRAPLITSDTFYRLPFIRRPANRYANNKQLRNNTIIKAPTSDTTSKTASAATLCDSIATTQMQIVGRPFGGCPPDITATNVKQAMDDMNLSDKARTDSPSPIDGRRLSATMHRIGEQRYPHYKDDPRCVKVNLNKGTGGLGFTIQEKERRIYVKELVRDPALSDGRIKPSDQIISVNGETMCDKSREQAIQLLRGLKTGSVELVVRHKFADDDYYYEPGHDDDDDDDDDHGYGNDKAEVHKDDEDDEHNNSQWSSSSCQSTTTTKKKLRHEALLFLREKANLRLQQQRATANNYERP